MLKSTSRPATATTIRKCRQNRTLQTAAENSPLPPHQTPYATSTARKSDPSAAPHPMLATQNLATPLAHPNMPSNLSAAWPAHYPAAFSPAATAPPSVAYKCSAANASAAATCHCPRPMKKQNFLTRWLMNTLS